MTREAAADGLALLCAAFRNQLTEQLVTVYWIVLGDKLSDDEWRARVQRALETKRTNFWPPPGYFIQPHDAAEQEEADAMAVWQEIVSQCELPRREGNVDPWTAPVLVAKFGKAAASVVAGFGGGTQLRTCSGETLLWYGKDFARLYPVARRKREEFEAERGVQGGALPGNPGVGGRVPGERDRGRLPAAGGDAEPAVRALVAVPAKRTQGG